MNQTRTFRRFPRRTALAGLGASVAATALRPLISQAQGAPAPQRLLIIHRPIGTVPAEWWPTGAGDQWAASSILSELDALHHDMVVLRGLKCPQAGWTGNLPAQGMLAMMSPPPPTGGSWPELVPNAGDSNNRFITATAASIDQLLLQHVPGLQGTTIASLQLGVSQQAAQPAYASVGSLSYSKPAEQALATPLAPLVDPSAVLQQLLDAAAGPNAVAALDKSLYGFLTTDVQRLRDRAPSSESPKLDAHLEALRALEAEQAKSACSVGSLRLGPLPPRTPDRTEDEARYDEVAKQQLQLIKAAFQCDLTRVITFTFAPAQSNLRFWKILPPDSVNNSAGLYELSQTNQNDTLQARLAIERYFAARTAQLLLDLKNTPDPLGTGSLLDNTLVVYLSECSGEGYHGASNMPVLAFGGKFLGLNGGSYLDFFNDRYMCDFWVATANAWGHDMPAFGAPEWNTGPLKGLYG